MVPNPPMPEAMNTPTRVASCGVIVNPESRIANSDAAMAYWMNASIFLTSFLSMNASGSNPFTSPAMCVLNCVTSKRVMVAIPLQPRRIALQFASVPTPTDDTSPIPVITTRLLTSASTAARRRRRARRAAPLLLALRVALDVLDGFLHPGDFLGVLIRDLDPEFLFERHHQF